MYFKFWGYGYLKLGFRIFFWRVLYLKGGVVEKRDYFLMWEEFLNIFNIVVILVVF